MIDLLFAGCYVGLVYMWCWGLVGGFILVGLFEVVSFVSCRCF